MPFILDVRHHKFLYVYTYDLVVVAHVSKPNTIVLADKERHFYK